MKGPDVHAGMTDIDVVDGELEWFTYSWRHFHTGQLASH